MNVMNLKSEGIDVPDSLKMNLEWYIANQKDLAEKYNGKVLLIVDQKLVKVFDDMAKAYIEASNSYPAGTFTLQPCSPYPESYTLMLYSPQYGVFA
jgi:3-phosphoglycerate kinase